MRSLDERLMRRVQFGDGCWNWTGGRDASGYGSIRVDRSRVTSAHRLSWELANGQMVPEGTCVCHTCDNRLCVNPDHLFLGSRGDNNADRHVKGRSAGPKGERHSRAILRNEDILAIRASSLPVRELVELYHCSESCIRHVISRKNWKHIV